MSALRQYAWRSRSAVTVLNAHKEPQVSGVPLLTLEGVVYTERGLVAVRSVGGEDRAGWTVYRFIRRGRFYVISEDRSRSRGSLVRMATRLIRGQIKISPTELS